MMDSNKYKSSEAKQNLQFRILVFSGILLFAIVLCILILTGCKYGRSGGGAVFYACDDCISSDELFVYVDGKKIKGSLPSLVYNIVCGPGCEPKETNPSYPNYTGPTGQHIFQVKNAAGTVLQEEAFTVTKNECLQIQVRPRACFPNQTSGGGGNTGGTGGTGGSGGTNTTTPSCASMSSYISFVSAVKNVCSNNSGTTFTFKNTSNQKLEVRVAIKLNSGAYSCQFASPDAGKNFDVWTCNATTSYGEVKAILYSDWVQNCTFGACP